MKVGLKKLQKRRKSGFRGQKLSRGAGVVKPDFRSQELSRGAGAAEFGGAKIKVARLGDTLVEVILAIAIFSMVGVAAVAVISSSSSGAQAALELTTTREAIDEQVELLRYIHNSMLVGTRSDIQNNTKYRNLWSKIVGRAKAYGDVKDFINNYGSYDSCEEIYGELNNANAFILNPRQIYLGDYDSTTLNVDEIVKVYNSNIFMPAQTSPRLIYGSVPPDDFSESLYEMNGTGNDLTRVEGIFIIAVRDGGTTTLVQNGTVQSGKQAFYDFYIRSCWFGPSADRPSTISTLIRLIDPLTVGT